MSKRKPVRGRFSVTVPTASGGSYKVETLPEVSLTPRQIVDQLREYADHIERCFVAGAEAPHA